MSNKQARTRKCGLCNGSGSFYPIDHGPVRVCEICNGLGMLRIRKYEPRGNRRSETEPRDSKKSKSTAKVPPGARQGRKSAR